MKCYRSCVRPLLFRMDPEFVHSSTINACAFLGRIPPVRWAFEKAYTFEHTALKTELSGMQLRNPVGLAAGWDKSGHAIRMLGSLGFGFAEIGSVSAELSHGNPKPRLFRLPEDEAIIVHYGLPNDGADTVSRRIITTGTGSVPLGVNIVKTNMGPGAPQCSVTEVFEDYLHSVKQLHSCCDYLTLNLSCPNAEGGKDIFADPSKIAGLLKLIDEVDISRPVFLKIIPNEDRSFLSELCEVAAEFSFVRGFMFNLSPGKPDWLRLHTPKEKWLHLPGAVSGVPVCQKMDDCIRALYQVMPSGRFQIIGVGGIASAEDAYRKICLGASAVQIYTAMVYNGPGILKTINMGLLKLLENDGFSKIEEAVGSANH